MNVVLPCQCHKVTTDGYIYSRLEQYSKKGKQGIQTTIGRDWKKLNPTLTKSGYLQCNIHGRIIRVNRLIAINFLPNPYAYPEVHHANGIKTDNRINNLEWGNQKQNADDRDYHGKTSRGSMNGNAKINEEIAKNIFLSNKSLNKTAQEYRVSKKLVLLIKHKRIWKHIHKEKYV